MTSFKMRTLLSLTAALVPVIVLAIPAHANPDDDSSDGPSITDEICGAFDLGLPPGEIPGRLGQNDGRYRVRGTHTYSTRGPATVTVAVTSAGGAGATLSDVV